MSQAEFEFVNLVQHPYKPGFESFTYIFTQSGKELKYNIRISDTLIGQWDLEDPQDLKKGVFLYLVKKFLKNDKSEDIELNAYLTLSPNQFPYKTEMDETEFPPKQKITININ